MKRKVFTRNEMINKFETLSATKKVNILWDALSLMNQYNGRNHYQCVFMAMGYESDDQGGWRLCVA